MIRQLLCFLILFFLANAVAAQSRPKLYLLPGMGGDHRLFKNLDLSAYDTTHVRFPTPDGPLPMADFARLLHPQIDTTEAFSLLGVSFGGMLAVELTEQLHPTHTILISSAKQRSELPGKIAFNRVFPLYRIIGGRAQRALGGLGRWLFERRARSEEPTFKAMLRAKDPAYLKWATYAVTNWQRDTVPPGIVHIQGAKDQTLPIKNIPDAIAIPDGGHMVVMMQAAVVDSLVGEVLLAGE